MPPRTNTNPGMLNFRDLGYKELNNAVPPKVQSISMEETVEKSDPKKKRKQQINPYITAMRKGKKMSALNLGSFPSHSY